MASCCKCGRVLKECECLENTTISESPLVTGYVLNREYGKTPNGNDLNGKWVLRLDGKFIDFDKYRNDLIERHNIKL
jgi:hypothetical protein